MSNLKSVRIAGTFAVFALAAVAAAALSPTVRVVVAPAEAAGTSPLGDLSSFRTIVVDTACG